MTKTKAKEIINNLKDGAVYGIFHNEDDNSTIWHMNCVYGKYIRVSFCGADAIPCNVHALCEWFTDPWHKDLCLKPVVWDDKLLYYVAS